MDATVDSCISFGHMRADGKCGLSVSSETNFDLPATVRLFLSHTRLVAGHSFYSGATRHVSNRIVSIPALHGARCTAFRVYRRGTRRDGMRSRLHARHFVIRARHATLRLPFRPFARHTRRVARRFMYSGATRDAAARVTAGKCALISTLGNP